MICTYYIIITIIFLLTSLKYRQLSLEFIKHTWNYLFSLKANQVNKNLKSNKSQELFGLSQQKGKYIYKYFSTYSKSYFSIGIVLIVLLFIFSIGFITTGSCDFTSQKQTCHYGGENGNIIEICNALEEKPLVLSNTVKGNHLGIENAPIQIVEFGCYGCEGNIESINIIRELIQKYPSQIYYTFINYPLPHIEHSFEIAEFTQCIQSTQPNKYWSFHSELRDTSNKIDMNYLWDLANTFSLDKEEIKTCIESEVGKQIVEKEIWMGIKSNIKTIPTFFVNGQGIESPNNISDLEKYITE